MTQEDRNLTAFISDVGELYKPTTPGRKPTKTGFDDHFQNLKKLSADLRQSKEEIYLSLAGQKPENKKKNRYKDIIPFDSTRVKLAIAKDGPNSDYINASFIRGAHGNQKYIASQGPLPETVLNFWQMLWQYNVSTIVMLCREVEIGKKKCERYWAGNRETKNVGEITVTLSKEEELKDGYCLRTIKAQKGDETRTIHQFHYTSWPDHGVPQTCFEIVTLINHIRDLQSYGYDETSPMCVHCSAGCGRTGAVLAIDYVRNLLQNEEVPRNLSMCKIVADMRRQRTALVQTKEQYEFVNNAISEMFRVYLQTRTVSYKGFDVGYQEEQYVNINIRLDDKPKEKRNVEPKTCPAKMVYENVDLRNRPKEETNAATPDSLQDYPAKLSVTQDVSAAFADVRDRKQSAPALLVQKPAPLPSAKPQPHNFKAPLNMRNSMPASQTQAPTPSPTNTRKETSKPLLPLKPKPKPELAPKKSLPLASNSPGNSARAVSPLHGKSAPDFSSPKKVKSRFLFSSHVPNANNSSINKALSKSHAPKQPQTSSAGKWRHDLKSPACEEYCSPKLTEHFDKAIKPPPKVIQEAKFALKPITKDAKKATCDDLNSSETVQSSNALFKGFLRPSSNTKSQPRPASQNYSLSVTPETLKSGLSASVYDLNSENGDTFPSTPHNTMMVRSASVSGIDSGNGEKASSFHAASNAEISKSGNSGIQVKVVSFGQGGGSYGPVYAATRLTRPPTEGKMDLPESTKSSGHLTPSCQTANLDARNPYENTGIRRHETFGQNLTQHSPVHPNEYVNTQFGLNDQPKCGAVSPSRYENHTVLSEKNAYVTYDDQAYANAPPQSRKSKHAATHPDGASGSSDLQDSHGSVLMTLHKGGGLPKPNVPLKPKPQEKTTPIKPQRSVRHNAVRKTLSTDPPVSASNDNRAPRKFQKYEKNSVYSDIVLNDGVDVPGSPSVDGRAPKNLAKYQKTNVYSDIVLDNGVAAQIADEVPYAELTERVGITRTTSNTSTGNIPSSPCGMSSAPPELPKRTPESDMILVDSPPDDIPSSPSTPPQLPKRTLKSKMLISESPHDGYLSATYEAVGASTLPDSSATVGTPPASPNHSDDTGRRASVNPTSTSGITAKAKKIFGNASNPFSKVGVSVTKSSGDGNSGSPPSTLENRVPTYALSPVVHSGQDMSFGKRLKRKVKGGRKAK